MRKEASTRPAPGTIWPKSCDVLMRMHRARPDADVSLTVLQGADIKTIVLKPVDRMNTMRKPAGI